VVSSSISSCSSMLAKDISDDCMTLFIGGFEFTLLVLHTKLSTELLAHVLHDDWIGWKTICGTWTCWYLTTSLDGSSGQSSFEHHQH